MAEWSFAVGDHTATTYEWRLEPTAAPTLNFYRSGQPHDFTCTILADSAAGLNLAEFQQDVWGFRDGELWFRGPLLVPVDTGDGNSHTIAITANSLRARVAWWPIPNNPPGATTSNFPLGTATASALGWDALELTVPHSDMAALIINAYTPSASVQVTQTAQSGTATDAAIDALASVQPFDWDLIPNPDGTFSYTTWSPSRGVARPDVVLSYDQDGGNMTFTRTPDMSGFGNEVWLTGQDALGNAITAIAPTSRFYGPEGLKVIVASSTTTDTSTTPAGAVSLQTQANTALAAAQTSNPSYVLTLQEGVWPGPDSLWLGDSPTIVIKSGRLNINEPLQIEQVAITPQDGAENVVLTVGAKAKTGPAALSRSLAAAASRLVAVEWRR